MEKKLDCFCFFFVFVFFFHQVHMVPTGANGLIAPAAMEPFAAVGILFEKNFPLTFLFLKEKKVTKR
jgi:hypothetical protein